MKMTQNIGAWGEYYAARLYLQKGYRLLARNSFNRKGKQFGEIDFIVCKGGLIVFVEVKTRISSKYGYPQDSVTKFKQLRIIKAVEWFRNQNPNYLLLQPRIDVCAIILSESVKFSLLPDLDKFVKYCKIITNAVELN